MKVSDGYRAVGLAAGLAAVALLTQALLSLLLAVLVAIILALPLAAAADRAERLGAPRFVGAALALLVLAALLTALGFVLVPEFVSQVREFSARLPSILADVQHHIGPLKGVKVGSLSTQLSSHIDGWVRHPQQLIGPLSEVSGVGAVLIAGLVVVAVAAFTLAVNPEPAVAFVLALVPGDRRPRLREVMGRIRIAWIGWMTAVGLDMVVLGSLLWAGMALIGLPFAIGFATFSALMTVIPNYGSIVSAIPPILAALAQSPGQAVLVLIIYLIVNQIEGNLILPLIMARTVDMHPALVSIGLLLMAALFGLFGVFIAIPLLSLVIILIQAFWVEPMEAAGAPALVERAGG